MNSELKNLCSNKFHRLTIGGWILSWLIFLVIYLVYVNIANPIAPYMDSVRMINQVYDVMLGESSWLEIWKKSGGLLYQLVTLFEWIFWGLNTKITVIITALTWSVLFFLYAKAFSSICQKILVTMNSVLLFFILQAFVGFYFFSPAGWEIWLLDLGLPQVLKNVIITYYLFSISKINYHNISEILLFAIGFVGGLIILFVAYNWSYAFAVSVISVALLRANRFNLNKKVFFLLVPFTLAQFIFVLFLPSAARLNSMAVDSNFDGFLDFFMSFAYGAFSIFIGNEAASKFFAYNVLALALGIAFCIYAVLIIYVYIRNHRLCSMGDFLFSLAIFGFCVLGSISFSRGGLGYEFAAASRYFMDYQFVLIGVVGVSIKVLFLQRIDIGSGPILDKMLHQIGVKLGVLLLFLIVAGHVFTYYVEFKKAPYRAIAYQSMARVYFDGEADEDSANLLQTTIKELEIALPIIRKHNLGPFRSSERRY